MFILGIAITHRDNRQESSFKYLINKEKKMTALAGRCLDLFLGPVYRSVGTTTKGTILGVSDFAWPTRMRITRIQGHGIMLYINSLRKLHHIGADRRRYRSYMHRMCAYRRSYSGYPAVHTDGAW
jgi:hypothetical protein